MIIPELSRDCTVIYLKKEKNAKVLCIQRYNIFIEDSLYCYVSCWTLAYSFYKSEYYRVCYAWYIIIKQLYKSDRFNYNRSVFFSASYMKMFKKAR